MQQVESLFTQSIGYEAVTSIAKVAKLRVQGELHNETLVSHITDQTEFWIDPNQSLFTSQISNKSGPGLVAEKIGPQLLISDWVMEFEEELSHSIVKMNIEGLDLDVIKEFKFRLSGANWPHALLFEVDTSHQSQFYHLWGDIALVYGIPAVNLELDPMYPHHIGVYHRTLCVSQVGTKGRNSLTWINF